MTVVTFISETHEVREVLVLCVCVCCECLGQSIALGVLGAYTSLKELLTLSGIRENGCQENTEVKAETKMLR